MKVINASVEPIIQKPGLLGIMQQIERCGRVCYKSEDKITEDSAKGFVERMIKSRHLAMLEHGTCYLKIPKVEITSYFLNFFKSNKYSVVDESHAGNVYITTNLRVLVENFYDQWLTILEAYHQEEVSSIFNKRYTAHFVISRGIANEFVRHRVFSFAQESTRYCNYTKDRFGGIQIIRPEWISEEELKSYINSEVKHDEPVSKWFNSIINSEQVYLDLVNAGLPPQFARGVLPLDLKTELVMTGDLYQWTDFFNLRYYEFTGKAHPDAKAIAGKWYYQLRLL